MKTLLFSALAFVIAAPAFAEIPEIRAKNVTCQELKDAVLNYGQVTVLTKSFLFTKRLTVSQEIECAAPAVKVQAQFKTSDDARCEVGFFCDAPEVVVIHTDHDHYRPRPGHWRPHPRPTPFPRPNPRPRPDHHPRPDRPIPSHTNPGPHWNPRPDHDRPSRPSHDRPSRPSHDRPSRPSHDRPSRPSHDRPSRPSHDRPSHDRPSHDRPSHDRPSRGSCHGRHCSL